MDPISSSFNEYIDQVTQIGDTFGRLVVKGMVLLVVVLFLTKFLGRFLALILTRFGMPERRAILAVTILHILVLLLAALLVLNMLGFPGILLFRIIIVIVMVGLAIFIIGKPSSLSYRSKKVIPSRWVPLLARWKRSPSCTPLSGLLMARWSLFQTIRF